MRYGTVTMTDGGESKQKARMHCTGRMYLATRSRIFSLEEQNGEA
jgi:hypothetical protein